MAAGDKVQKGQEWKVEFNNLSYTGYLPTDWTNVAGDADDEVIKDERGATITHILTDPRETKTGTLLIKSTGDVTPPDKGSYIWMQGPDDAAAQYYFVVSASVAFSSGVTRLSLSLILEDSQSSGATFTASGTQQNSEDYDLAAPADIVEALTMGDATTATSVEVAGVALTEDSDWSQIALTSVTLENAYLEIALDAEGEEIEVWIYFDVGSPLVLTVTCVDNT